MKAIRLPILPLLMLSILLMTMGFLSFRNARSAAIQAAVASFSAASFKAPVTGNSIIAAFGEKLASRTEVAATLPLPISLAGTTVRVNGQPAPLFFVSPGQINYLMPPGIMPGAATVQVNSGDGDVSNGTVLVSPVAPGLFSFSADGQGLAAGFALRVRANGSRVNEPIADCGPGGCRPVPIDLSFSSEEVFLILYGTGIRGNSGLSATRASIGGEPVEVLYAGPQPSLAGLDQINLRLPRGLRGRGMANIVFTGEGQPSNTVQVAIK